MAILIMAAVVIFGAFGYALLPVSELPNMDFPTISVRANLPGADPETMASAVATPLEGALAEVNGIDSMTSSSTQGSTNITLQFQLDRNIDAAAQDVQAAISGVIRRLPRAMPTPPAVYKSDPSAQPIFFIILTSRSLPISKVDLYARSVLLNQLSTVNGVAQVTVHGQAKYAVRIQANPAALAARQLTLTDLADAVNNTSTDQSSGTLNGPTKTAVIHTDGQLNDAAQFRHLGVQPFGRHVVRLEVPLLAGQQVSTLPGFAVGDLGNNVLQRFEHSMTVCHPFSIIDQRRRAAVRYASYDGQD